MSEPNQTDLVLNDLTLKKNSSYVKIYFERKANFNMRNKGFITND